MKKFPALLLLMAILTTMSAAQVPDSVRVKMDNISIPNSPGFILLDESPSVIDRPASPKAFATSIFNSYRQAGGFPSNYGVEFTPFWFFRHPRMTAYKYLGYNKAEEKQLPFSHIKKASISLAYVNNPDTDTTPSISNIAFGIRTTILSIRSRRNIQALKNANDQIVQNLRNINQLVIELDPLEPGYHEKVQRIVDNYENDPQLLESEEQLRQLIEVRPVFAIDAAIAYSRFFLNNKFSDQHFGRLGLWAVLNYSQALGKESIPKNYISLYGIFRYLQDGTVQNSSGSWDRTNHLDFGARAELELNKLSLSVEYLSRQRQDNAENTFRAVGVVNYRLSKSFSLTASFGRNFGEEQNLVTLFGLSFGLNSGNEAATIKD
jgi:hypothetical protein